MSTGTQIQCRTPWYSQKGICPGFPCCGEINSQTKPVLSQSIIYFLHSKTLYNIHVDKKIAITPPRMVRFANFYPCKQLSSFPDKIRVKDYSDDAPISLNLRFSDAHFFSKPSKVTKTGQPFEALNFCGKSRLTKVFIKSRNPYEVQV